MSRAERGGNACSDIAGPQDPLDPSRQLREIRTGSSLNGMEDMIHGSIFEARAPAHYAHARVTVTRTRRVNPDTRAVIGP